MIHRRSELWSRLDDQLLACTGLLREAVRRDTAHVRWPLKLLELASASELRCQVVTSHASSLRVKVVLPCLVQSVVLLTRVKAHLEVVCVNAWHHHRVQVVSSRRLRVLRLT